MAKSESAGRVSDALVFFGATGDLAYKQIFPALYALTKRGALNVPVVGVAHSGWTLEQLQARAKDSLEHADGGIDDRLEGRGRDLLHIDEVVNLYVGVPPRCATDDGRLHKGPGLLA